MLLDKLLFNEIGKVGKSLLIKAGLNSTPSTVEEMASFLLTLKDNIDKESFDGLLLGNILFSFVSSVDVRDRQVTSRIFEDLFSSIFSLLPSDKTVRKNPVPIEELTELDRLCDGDWKISTDLSGNKREKTDVHIGHYEVSIKTLKGMVYNEEGKVIDRSFNPEVNVGSFSFRALLKGILDDELLSRLKDRKGGLGSAKQVRAYMLNPIKSDGKQAEFLSRLSLFMRYVYSDDIFIVLKSHYQIRFILIPSDSFTSTIVRLYQEKESEFEKVWSRWENNNLRFQWVPMLQHMKNFGHNYTVIDVDLSKATSNPRIRLFFSKILEAISSSLDELVK